jgi:hypothetical protein
VEAHVVEREVVAVDQRRLFVDHVADRAVAEGVGRSAAVLEAGALGLHPSTIDVQAVVGDVRRARVQRASKIWVIELTVRRVFAEFVAKKPTTVLLFAVVVRDGAANEVP